MRTNSVCVLLVSYAVSVISFCSSRDVDPVVPINVVSLIMGDNPVYGYAVTRASHELAVEEMRDVYPRVFRNFSWTYFYRKGNFSCEEASNEVVVMMSEVYNVSIHTETPVPSVVMAPGCSLEILTLGDFAREFGLPLLASTATDVRLADKERYPTVVLFGAAGYSGIAQALDKFFALASWTSASLICDRSIVVEATVSVYQLCRIIADHFARARSGSRFDLQTFYADSSIDDTGSSEIRLAKEHSTVMLFLSHDPYRNKLLVAAADTGLADGNYVFIAPKLTFGNFTPDYWFDPDPVINKKLSTVLPYTFEISIMLPDVSQLWEKWKIIVLKAMQKYGQSVPFSLENIAVQMNAYETARILLQVFDESYNQLTWLSGKEVAQLFFNRAFRVPGENVRISPTGVRLRNIIIQHYSSKTNQSQPVWIFNASTGNLVGIETVGSIEWNGKMLPNTSNPRTGLWDQTQQKGADSYLYFIIIIMPIIGYVIVRRTIKHLRRTKMRQELTWLLDYKEFSNWRPVPESRIAGQTVTLATSGGVDWTAVDATYKGKGSPVRLLRVTISQRGLRDLLRDKEFRASLSAITSLDHPNVTKFYGIMEPLQRDHGYILVISGNGDKGILRNYIDQDDLVFNWDLRFSLMRDLMNALLYIHKTSIRYHGGLNFFNLVLDQHFNLQVARTGMVHLLKYLSRYTGSELQYRNIVPVVCCLWMAPEVLRNNWLPGQATSCRADVYSMGVILYEMTTRNPPFLADVSDPVKIEDLVNALSDGLIDTLKFPIPDVDPRLATVIRQCWSFEPSHRPSLHDISRVLKAVYPDSSGSFADSLIKRLQQYNAELESLVVSRTKALKDEMDKVESILCNVLPGSVARQLRNKELVDPEFFESVSILFSDIPAFRTIVSNLSPFNVVSLLHGLYTVIDGLIANYDAYKVETISDSYMVASGLPVRNGFAHAAQVADLALSMMSATEFLRTQTEDVCVGPLKLRIGINSGSCVGMVIGQKLPHYCLVGDTVNTASRMETNGEELKIHVTEATKCLLVPAGKFRIECRGLITLKGKGEVTAYWLLGRISENPYPDLINMVVNSPLKIATKIEEAQLERKG